MRRCGSAAFGFCVYREVSEVEREKYNIYNNIDRYNLHKCDFRNVTAPHRRMPRLQIEFDFVEFLLARHNSSKLGSALASFVFLTFRGKFEKGLHMC